MELPTMKLLLTLLLLLPGTLMGETYEVFLSHLDVSKPESLCRARQSFEAQFGDAARPGQPAALFALWAFHDKAVGTNWDTVSQLTHGTSREVFDSVFTALRSKDAASALRAVGVKDPQVWRRAEPWLRCGYVIMATWDDQIGLNPDPRFLAQYTSRIQADCRAYIELYLKESPVWLEYDGSLSIPWDVLRTRIRKWERFRAEHKHIPELAAHMNGPIKTMFQYYLCGLANSSPFDWSGKLDDNLRDSYKRFLLLNKDSTEYGLVEQAVNALERKQWQLDRGLIQLYKTHGYDTALLERWLSWISHK